MKLSSKKVLMIVQLVLIAVPACMSLWALTITKGVGTGMLADIFTLAALVFAILYIVNGCTKEDARFYKSFLIAYALALLADGSFKCKYFGNGYLCFTAYGILCILCVAENLGKKKSLIMGWIVVICTALVLGSTLILTPGVLRGGDEMSTQSVIRAGANFSMALIMLIMIFAKYKDKEARGSV